jgi:hypothetical protein
VIGVWLRREDRHVCLRQRGIGVAGRERRDLSRTRGDFLDDGKSGFHGSLNLGMKPFVE